MNTFIVLAHPEPKSFNGALFDTAVRVLAAASHSVAISDLYRMGFNPVSDRHNFSTVKDPDCLKLQIEETYASEHDGFAAEIEAEMRTSWVVCPNPGTCRAPHMPGCGLTIPG